MVKELLWKESLIKKLLSKWFWAYFFTMIVWPLWYCIRLIASNTLTVADVWLFYWVLSLITLLYSYNDLWLTESMQYYLPKYRLEWKKWQIKNVIWISFFVQMFTWVLIFLLLYLNAERLAINHFHVIEAENVIKIMSLYFLGYNIIQVSNVLFVSFQDSFSSGLFQSVNFLWVVIFSLIFRWLWILDVSMFALSWIIWVVMWITVWIIIILKKYKSILELERDKIDIKLLKQQFKYALWVLLTVNVWTLLWNVDQQLVLNKLWAENLWYFTNMLSLLNIFLVLMSPFVGLMFPIVTEFMSRKETEKLKTLESLMYIHFAIFSLVIWWLFFVFWQEIAVVLYGTAFKFSWMLLQILWPFLIFNCLNALNFSIFAWQWKIKQRFFILLVSLVVNVVCNVLFLYFFNYWLISVICVLAFSRIVSFLWSMFFLIKSCPFPFDFKTLMKNILLTVILSAIFLFIKNKFWILEGKSRINTLVILFILGFCYILCFAVLNKWKIKFLIKELKNFRNL